jgi:sugar diacid utilization regulator
VAPSLDEASSLEGLLENLGRDVIQVVVAPAGLGVAVGEPVIYDGAERSAISRGAVVLAVGVRAGTAQAEGLIAAAGQAKAAAVVFKATSELAEVVRDAETHGVAVLAVPEEMTWTQLHAHLNLSRFSTATGASTGIAGVPLGDLFALANAIAGVVGGAVTIEDPGRRVLAYSTLGDQPIDAARRGSILGRQVPDSPGMRTLYRQVLSTPGVMTADSETLRGLLEGGPADIEGLKPRSAVAIRAGSEAIGSIWVIHEDADLDDESERALVEAARIAVPHVIQARAARDVERRLRAEMLMTVLEGQGSVEEAAARLGFGPSDPVSVVAFEFADGEAGLDELRRERLVDLVVLHCEAACRQTSTVALGQIVYALLQADRPLDERALIRLAEQVQAHAEQRLGTALLAAVGPSADGVRDVSRARRETERVLGVLRGDGRARTVASIDDVRSEVVLHELKELSIDHPTLVRGKLERILAHDAEHNASYADTLRAYLDCFGDVPRAAERISVHPNTFRYRMRRLVELFDLDLDDPDERVVLELQLRFGYAPGRQVSTDVVKRSSTSGSGETPRPGPAGTDSRPSRRTKGSQMSSA